jgi:multidrug resistance efflux pump
VIFKLDCCTQEAALETARRKIAEVDAALVSAQADVLKAEGKVQEAKSSLQQAQDEVNVKSELQRRNPGIVPQRDIEKLQAVVDGRQGTRRPVRAVCIRSGCRHGFGWSLSPAPSFWSRGGLSTLMQHQG